MKKNVPNSDFMYQGYKLGEFYPATILFAEEDEKVKFDNSSILGLITNNPKAIAYGKEVVVKVTNINYHRAYLQNIPIEVKVMRNCLNFFSP